MHLLTPRAQLGWRPPKSCTVCIFRPGGLQNAVMYPCVGLEASNVLYCMHVWAIRPKHTYSTALSGGLQSAVLYGCLGLQASKVLYCMHVWAFRPPKCCNACTVGPACLLIASVCCTGIPSLESDVLYVFFGRLPKCYTVTVQIWGLTATT